MPSRRCFTIGRRRKRQNRPWQKSRQKKILCGRKEESTVSLPSPPPGRLYHTRTHAHNTISSGPFSFFLSFFSIFCVSFGSANQRGGPQRVAKREEERTDGGSHFSSAFFLGRREKRPPTSGEEKEGRQQRRRRRRLRNPSWRKERKRRRKKRGSPWNINRQRVVFPLLLLLLVRSPVRPRACFPVGCFPLSPRAFSSSWRAPLLLSLRPARPPREWALCIRKERE